MKLNKSGKDVNGGGDGAVVLALELAVEAAQVTPAPVVAGGEPPPSVWLLAVGGGSHGEEVM